MFVLSKVVTSILTQMMTMLTMMMAVAIMVMTLVEMLSGFWMFVLSIGDDVICEGSRVGRHSVHCPEETTPNLSPLVRS